MSGYYLRPISGKIAAGVFSLLGALFCPKNIKDGERRTRNSQTPITRGRWFWQKVIGINADAYWPVHHSSVVSYAKRIIIGKETSPGWSPGCMVHGINGIYIGDYTQISQNVAILSGNHDPYYMPRQTVDKPIRIGRYCLLGYGSVILPGVNIGDYTIVAANSVVTKSFPEGYVVLAGAPAKIVRRLDPNEAEDYENPDAYIGYIPHAKFAAFSQQFLDAR